MPVRTVHAVCAHDCPDSCAVLVTVEFGSDARQGFDPLPVFYPPDESRNGTGKGLYPLQFLPCKADNCMNPTFAHLPAYQTTGDLEVHVSDAAERQILEGDWVAVYNGGGRIRPRAQINSNPPRGVWPPAPTGTGFLLTAVT